MKTARILFLIARTHGLMSHLLKTQDYTRLMGTRDMQRMADYLLATDYSRELSLISTSKVTAIQLEGIIYKKLSERWFSLLAMSSGKTRDLLEAYDERLEIENLKKVIRAVHGKENTTTELFISVPRKYQNVNFRALSVAKSMTEVADLLKETPYSDFEKWLAEYETHANSLILEAQLDKTYYTNLWNRTYKNSDRHKIRDIIGTEIDIRNLQVILSAKFVKLDPQLVRRMTIDLGHRLHRSVVTKLASGDLQGVTSTVLWPSYSQLMHSAVELVNEGRLIEVETLLSRYTYTYAESIAIKNPNSLAYVFAYLSLCLREARNLTTLAIGKQMNIKQESLRSLLS